MHKKSPLARLMCAALLILTACQDIPTAIVAARGAPRVSVRAGGKHLGQARAYCVEGRRASAARYGWQTRVDTLFFPRAEMDQSGRTIRYQLRIAAADGSLLSGADCVIPFTEAAMRRVDRRYGVTAGGAAEQFAARTGTVTTQDCVAEGTACVFDPLVVVAPPPSPADFPPCPGCDAPFPRNPRSGGDGSNDNGLGSGEDNSTKSPYEQGPLAWVACVGAGLTAIGGGLLSYVAVEQYFMAVQQYASAKLRYEYAETVADRSKAHGDMLAAEDNVNVMTLALAGSASVTAGALLGVVALCSPSVLLPTP